MSRRALRFVARKRWIALLVLATLSLTATADARRHRSKKDKEEASEKDADSGKSTPSSGTAAPAAGDAKDGKDAAAPAAALPTLPAQQSDFPAAIKKAEDSYRQTPGPDLLLLLGMLADGQGKLLEAQDFMRRYLADPLVDASAPGRAEAERVMAKERPASGEVQIIADQNGMVVMDGRLVGSLPLSAPLLVSPGKHAVALELRDRTMKGQLKAVEGRGMEMNFSRANGAVVVTLPTAVIVLPRFSGPAPSQDVQRKFVQAAELGVTQARLAVFNKDVALKKAEKAADCLDTVDCQAQLAGANDVDYVLVVNVDHTMPVQPPAPPPAKPGGPQPPLPPPIGKESWAMRLSLVDADTVDVAAASEPPCPGCAGDGLVALVTEQVRNMVKEAQAKPRGSWSITSEPPGAAVRVGNRVIGKTPINRPAFAGSFELIFEKPQFKTEKQEVQVQAGQKATVAVTLSPAVSEVAPKPAVAEKPAAPAPKRPVWRIVTGSLLAALGVGMVGFGISALSVNGQCVLPAMAPATKCFDRFTTGTVGGALVGVGAVAVVGGVLMIAIPDLGKKSTPGKSASALVRPPFGTKPLFGSAGSGWGLSFGQ